MKQLILNDICELIVDCEHKTAPTQETGYPSIRTPNVGRGRLILDGVNRVSEETYKLWSRRAVPQADDIILAREAPLGNAAIIPPNLEVCLGQRTVLIRPDKSKVNPQYLVYLLLGDEIQGTFHGLGAGATVPHLNMKDIRELVMPELPPLETQRRIAAILSAYDDLIENNTRRIKALEQAAHDLYREWFVEFRFPGRESVALVDSGTDYGMIPHGWGVVRFKQMAKKHSESIKPYDHPDEQFAHYSIPAFDNGKVPIMESGRRIQSNKYLVPNRSIMVSKINPRISRTWLPDLFHSERPIASTEFLIFTPIAPITESFLASLCSSEGFSGLLRSLAGGTSTSHQRVKPGDLLETLFLKPDSKAILDYSSYASPIFSEVAILRQKNLALREARDLLLPRLVSGQLDVRDIEIYENKG